MVRFAFPVLLAAAAPSAGTAAQGCPSSISVDEAVDLALKESTMLRAKRQEYRATQANEIMAGLRTNPVASYVAEQLGNRNVDPQHTVTLGQPIELGGKRQRRLDSARAASQVTAAELDDLRRQVVAQVKKAFTDLLVADAILNLTAASLRSLDEVERLQRIRAEKGDISELELTRLQLQRFAFERDLVDARQATVAARIALGLAMGRDTVPPDVVIVGELTRPDGLPDAEDLRRRALDARPDLKAAEAARIRARADRELARANAWWDVTPQLEYQRIGSDNTFGIGVSVPIRVFDRNQGEVARTRAEIERAEANREATLQRVLAEVDTALNQVTSARDTLKLLNEVYLPKAQRARDTVEFAYRRGGVSLLDFLDAERAYRDTTLEHVRALGGYQTALDELEAAVGYGKGR
jgi:outer membrane protein, heavy metal efflux system